MSINKPLIDCKMPQICTQHSQNTNLFVSCMLFKSFGCFFLASSESVLSELKSLAESEIPSTNHPCKLINHTELLSCRFLTFYTAVKFGPLLWSKKIQSMFQNKDEKICMYDTGNNGCRKVHNWEIHKLYSLSKALGHCYTPESTGIATEA